MKHLFISFIKGATLTMLIAMCVFIIGQLISYFSQFGDEVVIVFLLILVTIAFTIAFYYNK